MKLTTQRTALAIALSAAVLAACGGGSSKKNDDTPVVTDPTPTALQLEFLGRYSTGSFGVSAAEIPAYDAASKRAFVVNARSGKLDVLDLSNPAEPKKLAELDADSILAGAEINSVAVRDGLVAVAAGGTSIEDAPGPRTGAMGTLNLGYVLDLDGHKLCMLHRVG